MMIRDHLTATFPRGWYPKLPSNLAVSHWWTWKKNGVGGRFFVADERARAEGGTSIQQNGSRTCVIHVGTGRRPE
jgi:hypothetical protein